MTDAELTVLAGTGSYDGSQEFAERMLLARLTARRAAELDVAGTGPTHDYRVAVEAYVGDAQAAFDAGRARGVL